MERDHFPFPDRYGGTVRVWACRGCHDKKDRTPFANWDIYNALPPVIRLWNSATTEERLVWAKLLTMFVDALNIIAREAEIRGIPDYIEEDLFAPAHAYWARREMSVDPFIRHRKSALVEERV
jgi:hypothetical protein